MSPPYKKVGNIWYTLSPEYGAFGSTRWALLPPNLLMSLILFISASSTEYRSSGLWLPPSDSNSLLCFTSSSDNSWWNCGNPESLQLPQPFLRHLLRIPPSCHFRLIQNHKSLSFVVLASREIWLVCRKDSSTSAIPSVYDKKTTLRQFTWIQGFTCNSNSHAVSSLSNFNGNYCFETVSVIEISPLALNIQWNHVNEGREAHVATFQYMWRQNIRFRGS